MIKKTESKKLNKKPEITITVDKGKLGKEVIKNPGAFVFMAMLKKPDDKTNKQGEPLGVTQVAGEEGDILFSLYQLLDHVRENFGLEKVMSIISLLFQKNLKEMMMVTSLQMKARQDKEEGQLPN